MTLLNAALNGRGSIESVTASFQFIDGSINGGLEDQMLVPIASREEMAGDAYGRDVLGDLLTNRTIQDSVMLRVQAIPEYVRMFQRAFPGEIQTANNIRETHIARAIAAFERELVTPGSRYDAFVDGDYDVFTAQEKRGFDLFFGQGLCGDCHRGPMLSDYTFRCQGVGDAYDEVLPGFEGKNGQGGDWGRFHAPPIVRFADDKYFFRVLTVRNVELRPRLR
jgi:cytochrome c peroxidase